MTVEPASSRGTRPAAGWPFAVLMAGWGVLGGAIGATIFVTVVEAQAAREAEQGQEALLAELADNGIATSGIVPVEPLTPEAPAVTSTTVPATTTVPTDSPPQAVPATPADTTTTTAAPDATTTSTTVPAGGQTEATTPAAESPVEAPAPTIPAAGGDHIGIPTFAIGDPIATINIPQLDLNYAVVHGDGAVQLKVAIGHMPGTPLPGLPGNAVLAGHRTSNGRPFYDLDQLAAGQQFTIAATYGTFTYQVTRQETIEPSNVAAVATNDWSTSSVSLYSCTPRGSTRFRLVVHATLINSVPADGVVIGGLA